MPAEPTIPNEPPVEPPLKEINQRLTDIERWIIQLRDCDVSAADTYEAKFAEINRQLKELRAMIVTSTQQTVIQK